MKRAYSLKLLIRESNSDLFSLKAANWGPKLQATFSCNDWYYTVQRLRHYVRWQAVGRVEMETSAVYPFGNNLEALFMITGHQRLIYSPMLTILSSVLQLNKTISAMRQGDIITNKIIIFTASHTGHNNKRITVINPLKPKQIKLVE